jgi:hypothetical protein
MRSMLWTIPAALIAAACLAVPVRAEDRAKPVRKPGVCFLLSAILPGAGQLYNGDDRGYVYLGIEAAAWFARLSYIDAGHRKENDFERFANIHWTFRNYRGSNGILGANYTPANDSLLTDYSRTARPRYYDQIGKDNNFRAGWDDWAGWSPNYDPAKDLAPSPNRAHYRKMRQQSSDLLNRGRLALAAAMMNRVVSGVDAFRTARGRVSRAGGSSLHLETGFRGGNDPQATLALVKVLP